MRLLLRYRLLRWRNVLRHHFDAGTLLRLGLLGVVMLLALGRSPTDIGISLGTLTAPGSGARWFRLVLVLLLPASLLLHRRARALRAMTGETARLQLLAVPTATIRGWALRRFGAVLAVVVFGAALPALPGGPSAGAGVGRALLLAATIGATGLLAWRRAGIATAQGAARRIPRPATMRVPRRRWTLAFPGGAVSALVRRDLLHLVRTAPGSPGIALVALAALPLFVIRAPGDSAFLTLGVLQAVLAGLQVNALMTLYERDARNFPLFKALDLPGRVLWSARLLLAIGLLALPTVPALLLAWVRQPEPALGAVATLLVLVVIPLLAGLLFANVGVALVPRVGLATFFLNAILGLTLFLWFFVPVAVPPLLLIVLVYWGRRAPTAFDRLEAE